MKTMAEVLAEHAYHNTEFMGIGRWQIECNCDELVSAPSHPAAEHAFAAHQEAMLTAAGFGPVKAAQAGALRDAADELEGPLAPYLFTWKQRSWLRARAAAVEGERDGS